MPLIKFNPYIDHIITNFHLLNSIKFDIVYSLEDEDEIADQVSKLNFEIIHGSYILDGTFDYTDSSKEWFDMGLRSKFGKSYADKLKKQNSKTHGEIFSKIFNVNCPIYNFYNDSIANETSEKNSLQQKRIKIGLNLTAGKKWPSKSLPTPEMEILIDTLINKGGSLLKIYLIGGRDELHVINRLCSLFKDKVDYVDTSKSPLELALLISTFNLLISSDSLSMHLAIAQHIPVIAFFTVTSAAEIGADSYLKKIVSNSTDYCSFKPFGDNSSPSANDIYKAIDWDILLNSAE